MVWLCTLVVLPSPFSEMLLTRIVRVLLLRHIGIYAYRASYLKAFAKMDVCPLEDLEKLEQLRAMWYGSRIHVEVAKEVPGHGVDTEEDLIAVEKVILAQKY